MEGKPKSFERRTWDLRGFWSLEFWVLSHKGEVVSPGSIDMEIVLSAALEAVTSVLRYFLGGFILWAHIDFNPVELKFVEGEIG